MVSFVLLLSIILLPLTSCKKYRTDYVYNRKTDAFYKFHIESVWFERAKTICRNEGANVIEIASEEDVSQVHGMFKQYPDLTNYFWINFDGKTHESVEEKAMINFDDQSILESTSQFYWERCDVMTRSGDVKASECYRPLPFVCKVAARDAFFDARCMVYGKGYQYYENVGSCYKIPAIPFSWDEAYSECRAEGAHLVVLNSETEHRLVRNLTNSAPHIPGARTAWFFHVGIRAEKKTDGSPIVFKTIFNQTLELAGYSEWSPNEPNNDRGKELCGTILKNDGKYNDVDCSEYYGFVCENEVKNT